MLIAPCSCVAEQGYESFNHILSIHVLCVFFILQEKFAPKSIELAGTKEVFNMQCSKGGEGGGIVWWGGLLQKKHIVLHIFGIKQNGKKI